MTATISVEMGVRLFNERKRMNLTQGQMAEIAGVSQLTYGNYERGVRAPDGACLALLHKAGLDVLYVVAGIQNEATISEDDTELLVALNSLDTRYRQSMITGVLEAVRKFHSLA